jgi:hypothetical protein
VNTDRLFFGGSVDFAMIPDALDTTVYYVDQTYGDLVDRQAVGGEFRYFNSLFTSYGIYDYDLHFEQTNLALLNGSLRFEDESSISVAVDYRRSPMLTTLNAIIGQGVENPNDLLATYPEEEIYQLAQDRTAYSRSASISVSRPITENLQINVDVIATNVSGTKASGGVEAFPTTGTEYYYSGQLVASDLFTEGAIFIAGVRYADTITLEQQTLQFNMRYPILRDLRLLTGHLFHCLRRGRGPFLVCVDDPTELNIFPQAERADVIRSHPTRTNHRQTDAVGGGRSPGGGRHREPGSGGGNGLEKTATGLGRIHGSENSILSS